MKSPLRPAALLFVSLLVLSACQPSASEAPASSIFVSGSSTVEPISLEVAENFSDQNPNVQIAVEGPGTSDGFALFCAGDSDVQDASRSIRDTEIEECEANGIDFIELYIAIDGLSVITSTLNDTMECLSFTDLWALLGPENTSENGDSWIGYPPEGSDPGLDVNQLAEDTFDATDGGFGETHTPYPDVPLFVTAPGEESGTFDSFVELALVPVGDALGMEDVTTRLGYQSSGDDNVIIQGVAGDEENPETLGWVGFAYVEANLDLVKPLAVDGGAGCVEPTVDTISSDEYPIARPLFVYVSVPALEDNPALVAFMDFYLSDDGRASVSSQGYVDIPDADWDATVANWESRTTGTQVGN